MSEFPWASVTVMLAALAVFWKVVWDYAQMKSRSLGNIGRKEYERKVKAIEVRIARLEEQVATIKEHL